jgi:hypothetical protein
VQVILAVASLLKVPVLSGTSGRLAKITENAILRDMAACIVSFVDIEGLRHSVEVEAETLYEAAVLAVRTFKQHHCEPGELSKIEVEIRSSITHTVTLKKIHSWLQGGARSPKEAVTKERLRALI